MNGTYDFTHVAGENTALDLRNFELPIFNRNQGEIARTNYALDSGPGAGAGGQRHGSFRCRQRLRSGQRATTKWCNFTLPAI